MARVHANGIDIEYEVFGDPGGAPLLLVNGFRAQLTSWPDELLDELVGSGFRTVVFDNRDAGLTTRSSGPPPAYGVADMATDGMELLRALGIGRAHVAGASMGGMIVQHMAFGHPERVLSMTSIMSSPGAPGLGTPDPTAMELLSQPYPPGRQAYVDHAAVMWRAISGPHYDEARTRAMAVRAYDRSYHPEGAAYQAAALAADGDRTSRLATIRCPALVVHGRLDPLVPLAAGEATAAAIPGAELVVFDDMGHDIPVPRVPDIVAAIAKVAARA